MRSYTIEFNGTGEVSEGRFADDTAAESWVISVLERRGYDADAIVSGDWDADGMGGSGGNAHRMLFWSNEHDAENDAGANAICQLCVIR